MVYVTLEVAKKKMHQYSIVLVICVLLIASMTAFGGMASLVVSCTLFLWMSQELNYYRRIVRDEEGK